MSLVSHRAAPETDDRRVPVAARRRVPSRVFQGQLFVARPSQSRVEVAQVEEPTELVFKARAGLGAAAGEALSA